MQMLHGLKEMQTHEQLSNFRDERQKKWADKDSFGPDTMSDTDWIYLIKMLQALPHWELMRQVPAFWIGCLPYKKPE